MSWQIAVLTTTSYLKQKEKWPNAGRHILAQYDDETIIVYQAFCPAIGNSAVKNQRFGGDFSFSRMSWIKPSFLWMMYRSGWATKADQEVTLAVKIKRAFFDSVLAQAVPTAFDSDAYEDLQTWKKHGAASSVRVQWDPDRSPPGGPLQRLAIQLGLRGQILREYSETALVEIIDLSEFVESQRIHVQSKEYSRLVIPVARRYAPFDPPVMAKLKLACEA